MRAEGGLDIGKGMWLWAFLGFCLDLELLDFTSEVVRFGRSFDLSSGHEVVILMRRMSSFVRRHVPGSVGYGSRCTLVFHVD